VIVGEDGAVGADDHAAADDGVSAVVEGCRRGRCGLALPRFGVAARCGVRRDGDDGRSDGLGDVGDRGLELFDGGQVVGGWAGPRRGKARAQSIPRHARIGQSFR